MTLETFRDSGILPALTYEILVELVKRKKEENRYKKYEWLHGALLLIFACTTVGLLFFSPGGHVSVLHGLTRALSSPPLWVLSSAAFFEWILYDQAHKKAEEAGDDFDALREEIIDRGGELWPKEYGNHGRIKVLRFLRESGINLYHK